MAHSATIVKQANKSQTRITVTLEHEDHENVVRTAREKRVSASWIVRDAVRMYFSGELHRKQTGH